MTTTIQEKVREFNRGFGLEVLTEPQPDRLREDPKLIHRKMELIREEMRELEEAVSAQDPVETMDALLDLEYVINGMAIALGMDMDRGMERVHASNMSKLCQSEEDAIETVAWYRRRYEEGESLYDSPVYAATEDGRGYIVRNESTNKILKSIRYHPVDLRDLAMGGSISEGDRCL